MIGEGTCGAVASGALAIGVALGNPRDKQDAGLLWVARGAVRDTVVDKYYREYGSILCRDVQRGFFAKARNLTHKA